MEHNRIRLLFAMMSLLNRIIVAADLRFSLKGVMLQIN